MSIIPPKGDSYSVQSSRSHNPHDSSNKSGQKKSSGDSMSQAHSEMKSSGTEAEKMAMAMRAQMSQSSLISILSSIEVQGSASAATRVVALKNNKLIFVDETNVKDHLDHLFMSHFEAGTWKHTFNESNTEHRAMVNDKKRFAELAKHFVHPHDPDQKVSHDVTFLDATDFKEALKSEMAKAFPGIQQKEMKEVDTKRKPVAQFEPAQKRAREDDKRKDVKKKEEGVTTESTKAQHAQDEFALKQGQKEAADFRGKMQKAEDKYHKQHSEKDRKRLRDE